MWVCSASKVLSSEIQSKDFLPLTPNPDLARLEIRSEAEGRVNQPEVGAVHIKVGR